MLKKILHGCGLGLGAALVALVLWSAGLFEGWEQLTWTVRVRLRAPQETPSPRVKVILIDQASLDWGRRENGWPWPWPRIVYTPILDFCRRSGARAVIFDMLFTEPSLHGVADDEDLGRGIRGAPPFVAALALGERSGTTTRWPPEMARPAFQVAGLSDWLSAGHGHSLLSSTALFPVPEIGTNISFFCNVMDVPDDDGVFRRTSLFRVFDEQPVPAMGLSARLAGRDPSGPQDTRIERGWLTVGDHHLPIDTEGRSILRFKGTNGFHDSVSAAAVIQTELRLQAGESGPITDMDLFKDCYVLLGPSAPALLDLRTTPLSDVAPGVELHATLLDNLLTDSLMREVPTPVVVLVVGLFGMLSGLMVSLYRKPWQNVLAILVFVPAPFMVGVLVYGFGWWLPVVVSTAANVVAVVGAIVVNYATEGRQKAFIKQAFKFYLSPQVIDKILEDPSQLTLGGEKRTLTLLFADIEKFSSFSERLDPPALTALLNDFLSDMTDIILEEGGTLDKYIGDAIVAFWNAPLDQGDHAVRAVRAALRCQEKLAARRDEFEARTGAVLRMRIGVNTGPVVVGNMGSRERFDYTVLGDAANLASRLEGANKVFGTYLMVSEATWTEVGTAFVGRELGRLRVVGREAPVRVFEPTGLAGTALPESVAAFEEGLAMGADGRWHEAAEVFASLEHDAAARAYLVRCRELPGQDGAAWDGIWNLTEK